MHNKIWISVGGFHNKVLSYLLHQIYYIKPLFHWLTQGSLAGKMYNTHVVIDSDGKIAGQYNKTHLFDVELPEKKIKLKESDYIEKGASIASPVESPIGKIGLGIVKYSFGINMVTWYKFHPLLSVLRCAISWIQFVISSNGSRRDNLSVGIYRCDGTGPLGILVEG